MVATLALVVALSVPGLSLRLIEEGSPAGPPEAWVLGEEVASAWDLADARWEDVGTIRFALSTSAERRIDTPPVGARVALLLTTPEGATKRLLEARCTGFPDPLPEGNVTLRVLKWSRWAPRARGHVLLQARSLAGLASLTDPRVVAALWRLRARTPLVDTLEHVARMHWRPLSRDAPSAGLSVADRRILTMWSRPENLPQDDLLRWWVEGPLALRRMTIAVLAAHHMPACVDLLREAQGRDLTPAERATIRLGLAAAGDPEQAAFLRARLVSDAPADIAVGNAALGLAVLGDVGALDGLRAVAATMRVPDERVSLAIRALERTLAARAVRRG